MTLQVPFEQFANTAKRVLGVKEAYVTRQGTGSLVTAGAPTGRTIVASTTPIATDAAKSQLKVAGFETFDGAWSAEGLFDLTGACFTEAYVGAVGYESADRKPGVWLDAFSEMPSQIQVMRAMYEEFRDTGELADVSFEEFNRLANATVIIVSPSQIRGYLEAKEGR